jgi:RNA polymerase sigma-70 factor, ECF subfamily
MVSDEALYRRWLEGDLAAFDALYARHERPLFGFICKQLENRAGAEDVLHETFLALLKDRASSARAVSLKAWLFQVARNLCHNQRRGEARGKAALEKTAAISQEPSVDPAAAHEAGEATAALQNAVRQLPAPLAELFCLRSAGLSYEEMAAVAGAPLGTVKSRMHELIQRLRGEVKPWTAR